MRCKICTAVDPETPTGDYTNNPIVSEMGIFRQRREVTRGSALRWESFCIADDSDRSAVSNSPPSPSSAPVPTSERFDWRELFLLAYLLHHHFTAAFVDSVGPRVGL